MQPLSLQSKPINARSVSSSANAGNAGNAGKAQQGNNAGSASQGGFSLEDLLPLITQLLQLVTQMFQQSSGGGNSANASGAQPAQSSGGKSAPQAAGGSTPPSGKTAASPSASGKQGGEKSQSAGGSQNKPAEGAQNANSGKNASGQPAQNAGQPSGTQPAGGAQPGNAGNGLVGPNQTQGTAKNASSQDLNNIDYRSLDSAQRQDFNGVDRNSAAVIHMGGRAHISGAPTASGLSPSAQMYNNVLDPNGGFKDEEKALAQQWQQQEIAQHGFATGENLDRAFIQDMGARNGDSQAQIQQRLNAVDARVAKLDQAAQDPAMRQQIVNDSQQQLNVVDDIGTLEGQSGLNADEQAAYRLAGHSLLFSGDGSINGDILPITLNNSQALDNVGKGNSDISAQTQKLMDADLADDGQLNGSSLRAANDAVMDKIFLGDEGIQAGGKNDIQQRGLDVAAQNGRSPAQIRDSIVNGGKKALDDFKNLAKDHSPAMLAAGTSMAAASAVCPFLGGMAAGAGGMAAGQQLN